MSPDWSRSKDLRIELRSRILINQVLPFAAIVMVLFAFALDSDDLLERVAPGWSGWRRCSACSSSCSGRSPSRPPTVRSTRFAPPGYQRRASSSASPWRSPLQLLVLEALLFLAAFVLYSSRFSGSGLALLITSALAASCGLGLVGTLYGGLTAGTKGRESLLPLLLLPVVAPVLIGATRATEAALGVGGISMREGWAWVALLAVYALLFGIGGSISFGPLVDDSV